MIAMPSRRFLVLDTTAAVELVVELNLCELASPSVCSLVHALSMPTRTTCVVLLAAYRMQQQMEIGATCHRR